MSRDAFLPDRGLSDAYVQNEGVILERLLTALNLSASEHTAIRKRARILCESVRAQSDELGLMDALLQEYDLTTEEGISLMRLAEAFLRTCDPQTANTLIREKIGEGAWRDHVSQSSSQIVNLMTRGLQIAKGWIMVSGGVDTSSLVAKLGDTGLSLAVAGIMKRMGAHFIFGADIQAACASAFKAQGQTAYSFDMLGEAARTAADAETYFRAYRDAVRHLAEYGPFTGGPGGPGISVKLSAIHPRYEYLNRAGCGPALVSKLLDLAIIAKQAGIGLTIDAEEADRLELSLLLLDALLRAPELEGWDGLGFVIQAYQRRALTVIDMVVDLARAADRKIMIRLVKGAYWDTEIKRAQEMGLESYPVFTRKENTDLCYLACADALLQAGDVLYPQFATHNAHSLASIEVLAERYTSDYEIQRLHGMGELLHGTVLNERRRRSRIYAPVGAHRDLLPYLVRRLLENGANSSFVHQLTDHEIPVEKLVQNPVDLVESNELGAHPEIPAPRLAIGTNHPAARGLDHTQADCAAEYTALLKAPPDLSRANLVTRSSATTNNHELINAPFDTSVQVGEAICVEADFVAEAVQVVTTSQWANVAPAERAQILQANADLLEQDMDGLIALCVYEAGKTVPDAIAEVREAVDFCRYYAQQSLLPRNRLRSPLGIVACISPWNFPLAIFLGQVSAALAAGNSVVAKPAPQTPLVATRAVELLHQAGVPTDAIQLLHGDGASIGSAITSHANVDAICFTGSTRTAKAIAASLAETGRGDVPLIAETGGINAMIIDSTALLEQAVMDVVASAFQSAGQRCSACRIVCVEDGVADAFEVMLAGAMATLKTGAPTALDVDVGPLIDAPAKERIMSYVAIAKMNWRTVCEVNLSNVSDGHFVPPIAFEVPAISALDDEAFGPVLHVYRFKAGQFESTIDEINALGFGLTLGLHTRIDGRVDWVTERAQVGNVYVNRNQIGAVVGVQPFGGEGLSGTGPKAGGPNYLLRLSKDRDAGQARKKTATPIRNAAPKADTAIRRIANWDRARVTQAQKDWLKCDRESILRDTAKQIDQTLASELVTAAGFARDLFQTAVLLPGPTGERNTWRLRPRGVLYCFGGESPNDLPAQIAISLASGNTVVVDPAAVGLEPIGDLILKLNAAGAPGHLITCADLGLADVYEDIAGIVSDRSDRLLTANWLAVQPGAILPLLSHHDDPERFAIERTVTINTTAAGGNASLLAMA